MKKCAVILLAILFFALAVSAQYQNRLSADDQQRFDSYYQRWQEYKRTNNADEVISMEKRMQDVMRQYNIPLTVSYDAIASHSNRDAFAQYRNRFSPEDQSRYDSYFQRWQDYVRTRNRSEQISMERRMQDVMSHYNIPVTVPFEALASSGYNGNYGGGYWNPWRGRLSASDQTRFDSYYTRWLQYRRDNDRDEIESMERRMRDVMSQYNMPSDVPFDRVASPDVAQNDRGYAYGYNDLRIVDATYGNGRRTTNVTSRLQQMVQNDRLSLRVDNDSMGSDPAPDHVKTLTIVYTFRGRQKRITVREKSMLTLP